jgi:hypothetical protein
MTRCRNPIALRSWHRPPLLIGCTLFVVPVRQAGSGDPVRRAQRIINRFQAGQQFGDFGAGVAVRVPFIDTVS